MKGFTMTPEMLQAMEGFCRKDIVTMDLDTIEELQDFILSAHERGQEKEAIGWLTFLRSLKTRYGRMLAAMEAANTEG